jgi:hypothetical protein
VADCLPHEVVAIITTNAAAKQAELLLSKAKPVFINISSTSLFSKNVLLIKVPHKE